MATLRRRHFATLWRRFGDAWRRVATLGDARRRLATLGDASGHWRRAAPRRDTLATVWRQFGDTLATLGDAWRRLVKSQQHRTRALATQSCSSIRPSLDPAEGRSIESCSRHKLAATPRQLQNGRFASAGQALCGNGSLIEWLSHYYNDFGQRPSRQKRGARFVDRTMVVDDVSTNGCLAVRS